MEMGEAQPLANPELPELQQFDQPALTVPVRVEGALTGYQLPNRRVQHSTDSVTDTAYTQIQPGSLKRSRGVLISMTDDIYITSSTSKAGSIWPKLVPYPISHTQPVFVKAATAATTTLVGSTFELWAD